MSRVAGIVTVNVMPRNEPPVPSCEGYPGSIFGDQSVQDLMVLGDIYNTDATLLWFEQNFPNEVRPPRAQGPHAPAAPGA